MKVLTVVSNGYDYGTAYYLNDELYAFVHTNDEYEKEDILLGIIESGGADKVDRIDIDNIIEKLEYSEDFNGEFQHPKSLTELKKALK